MTETNGNEPVRVVVNDSIYEIKVYHRGVEHFANWDDDEGIENVQGDEHLIRSALVAWNGENIFTLTWNELYERSGGWLPKAGFNNDGTPL